MIRRDKDINGRKEDSYILEGNEIDQKFDNGAGELIVDVDAQGGVKLAAKYSKDLNGYGKVDSSIGFESNILTIAEKIAAKTETKWDDSAVAGLKSILGIK